MKTKFLLSMALIIAMTTFSYADVITTSATGGSVFEGPISLDPTGDTFGAANAVFSAGGGALLHTGSTSYTFPAVAASQGDNILYPAGEDGLFSATSTPGGLNETIYTFTWLQASGAAQIPVGALIGGVPGEFVTTISYEMGSANTGSDLLEWLDGSDFTINHPDADGDGTFEADFTLFDSAGGTIFGGTWFVTPGAGGFEGVTFVGAGGADLGGFDIGGGTATVSIIKSPVPEPTSIALLSVLGLGFVSRRRR